MASDVNDNFKSVKEAVDDNGIRITNLERDSVNLKSSVSSFQTTSGTDQDTIKKLQNAVESLQKTVINQQATITLLESKFDKFQIKEKSQQEIIADFIERLETLEKKEGKGSHLNSE